MNKIALALISSTLLIAAPAYAQEFTASQSVEKRVMVADEEGNLIETFEEAVAVAPGDNVRYALLYSNDLAAPAEGVVLTIPVPVEMILIPDSISYPQNVTVSYSADGSQSFSVLENAALDVSEDINLDDATHVRWTFNEPVQPAESGTLSFIATLR